MAKKHITDHEYYKENPNFETLRFMKETPDSIQFNEKLNDQSLGDLLFDKSPVTQEMNTHHLSIGALTKKRNKENSRNFSNIISFIDNPSTDSQGLPEELFENLLNNDKYTDTYKNDTVLSKDELGVLDNEPHIVNDLVKFPKTQAPFVTNSMFGLTSDLDIDSNDRSQINKADNTFSPRNLRPKNEEPHTVPKLNDVINNELEESIDTWW